MEELIKDIHQTINEAISFLEDITEDQSQRRAGPARWSAREIIGHLIDSASNNHQRFVRAQLAESIVLPGYEQESWVSCQDYQNESWSDLVSLWRSYNLHLAHLLARVGEDKLDHLCLIGNAKEPVTLRFIAEDYVRHLKHHLKQIDRNGG